MLTARREETSLRREGLRGGNCWWIQGRRGQGDRASAAGDPDGRGIALQLGGHDAFGGEHRGTWRVHGVTGREALQPERAIRLPAQEDVAQ
eukprot:5599055-Alexandrium_andersonii.AAC.1